VNKKNPISQPKITRLKDIKVERLSTGIPEVDLIVGGGIRRRSVTQLVGPPGSGKSTIAFHLVAEAQKLGLKCAYLDVEGKVDPDYVATMGVDPNELLFVEGATTAEQYLDVVREFATSDDPDVKAQLIIYDSIVAAGAMQEIMNKDGSVRELGEDTIAALPRVLSKFFRNHWNMIRSKDTTFVCINQVRVQGIGTMFVTEGTSGGNALSHITEDEIHVNKVSSSPAMKWMYGTGPAVRERGYGIRLSMKKAGSGGIQGRAVDSQFIYLNAADAPEYDIASNLTLTHFAMQAGIITGRTSYVLPCGDTVRGKAAVYDRVCEDQELKELITKEYFAAGGVAKNVNTDDEEESENDDSEE